MAHIRTTMQIDTDTTLGDLREFVRLTEYADASEEIAYYDHNTELNGVGVFVNTDDLKSSKE